MKRFYRLALFAGLLTFFALMLGNASLAMDGVRRGLALCTETLFPALFPFLVLSELLMRSGAGELLGRLLGRPIAALFGLSREGASAVLMGWLCGQPLASTAARTLWEQGALDVRELRRITLFANNPSSGFLVLAVGSALFSSVAAGTALFFITLLSSALLGLGLRILFGKTAEYSKKPPNGAKKSLFLSDLNEAVKRSFSTLLQICAFLIFFCAVASCLSALLSFTPLPQVWKCFLLGLPELTVGISNAAALLPPAIAFRLCAFFAGFSGVCVCLQILSLTQGTGVSAPAYLLAKSVQGLLSLALCEIYLRVFQPALSTADSQQAFSAHAPLRLSTLALLVLLLLAFLLHKRKRRSQAAPPQQTKKGT